MDINRILQGVHCACGKVHTCEIAHIYIEHGAIFRLKELCARYDSILIVADDNTFSAADEKLRQSLFGKNLKKVIFRGKPLLIPNEDAIEKVRSALGGTDLILGVGSGVIQDLCKYVSWFSGIPYIIVATAPSMDGYASNGAAMILNGMKETVPAGLPKAIIADTAILKEAPLDMLKAGFGDIIGKYSALCDWKLSHAVNNEYFCPYIYETTFQMIENTLAQAAGILQRREESIQALMEALVTVGIMMRFAGSSRPASGSEHHLSHFFEIVGIVNAEPYLAHGIDVAYSSVITAQIRERILKRAFPNQQFRPQKTEYIKKMSEIYSSAADGCIALQQKAGSYEADRMPIYLQKEAEIRKILAQTPGSEKIKSMLSLIGLDINEFYNLYGTEKIRNAVSYAKDLKDRYTVLWLNYDLFGEERGVGTNG